ncbi:MAG: hypothetical protein ACR2LN_01265 [Candidatus Levyibacteriota bacterium]
MNIQIRKGEDTDLKAIEELNQVASDEDLLKYSKQKKNLFSLEEYFNNGGYFWVAEATIDQRIVGMIGIKKLMNYKLN